MHALLRVALPVFGIILAVSASGFGLPRPVATLFDLPGAAAGPCALFGLG